MTRRDKVDDFGWPEPQGIAHFRPPRLAPRDRDALVAEYIRRHEEDETLTVSEYARQECGRYSITAAYIRQIVGDRVRH